MQLVSTEPATMPVKKKYRTQGGVIKNGQYKSRTGNSHAKKTTFKRVPRAPRGTKTRT